MKKTLADIKNFFKKGLRPTEQQFSDTFDSFHHKDLGEVVTSRTVADNGDVTFTFSDNQSLIIEAFKLPPQFDMEVIGGLIEGLESKVVKADGKGLSSNDYTEADKLALTTISAKADVLATSLFIDRVERENGDVSVVLTNSERIAIDKPTEDLVDVNVSSYPKFSIIGDNQAGFNDKVYQLLSDDLPDVSVPNVIVDQNDPDALDNLDNYVINEGDHILIKDYSWNYVEFEVGASCTIEYVNGQSLIPFVIVASNTSIRLISSSGQTDGWGYWFRATGVSNIDINISDRNDLLVIYAPLNVATDGVDVVFDTSVHTLTPIYNSFSSIVFNRKISGVAPAFTSQNNVVVNAGIEVFDTVAFYASSNIEVHGDVISIPYSLNIQNVDYLVNSCIDDCHSVTVHGRIGGNVANSSDVFCESLGFDSDYIYDPSYYTTAESIQYAIYNSENVFVKNNLNSNHFGFKNCTNIRIGGDASFVKKLDSGSNHIKIHGKTTTSHYTVCEDTQNLILLGQEDFGYDPTHQQFINTTAFRVLQNMTTYDD